MKQTFNLFVLFSLLALSCTRENSTTSSLLHQREVKTDSALLNQKEEKIDNTKANVLTSTSYCTVNISGKYTGLSGASTSNGSTYWNWYIKNNSKSKVTATVEQVACSGGQIIYRIKKNVKLKPNERKYIGDGTYSVYSSYQVQWSIKSDKIGW